ncbi:MAG: hypothetical protein ACU0DW_06840 [Shimia sp.]
MKAPLRFAALGLALTALSACGTGAPLLSAEGLLQRVTLIDLDSKLPDKSRDRGFRPKDLSTMQAGIWIDPNGCDHWIIDDGIEGYLSQRVDRYGKPVCSGHGAETIATGPFRQTSTVNFER